MKRDKKNHFEEFDFDKKFFMYFVYKKMPKKISCFCKILRIQSMISPKNKKFLLMFNKVKNSCFVEDNEKEIVYLIIYSLSLKPKVLYLTKKS